MRSSIIRVSAALAAILFSSASFAVPTLQLDCDGCVYDTINEDVFYSGTSTDVYALLTTSDSDYLTATYSLTFAVLGASANYDGSDFGSFSLAGTSYGFSDLVWGTPADVDGTELPSHGIFDAWYATVEFSFDASNKATTYNVEDNPGSFSADASGGSYYEMFSLDTTNLNEAYGLHFDLFCYEGVTDDEGCTARSLLKAPFSHDLTATTTVPEPPAVILLGVGLLGLGILRSRQKKA
ncbi:MAG: choice-of-anchor N protein [Cellvibrionaceae bacterium]